MTFMEFTRRLDHCHLDDDTKYILSHMFEVQMEMNRQLDICAGLISALVNTTKGFTNLHEATQEKVKLMMQRGQVEGVSVRSEPNDD